MSERIRLVVLYGGRSAEHEVSCISAANVVAAVDPERYDLRLVGITTDGRWLDTGSLGHPSGARRPPLATGATPDPLPSPDSVAPAVPAPAGSDRPAPPPAARSAGSGLIPGADDADAGPLVVLPLVHGPMGEDGTVQGLLELAGLPYCGPGVAGSAIAMDKGLAKSVLTAAGIPQAHYLYRQEHHFDRNLPAVVEAELGWPVFVKPANMGSSIGISKVDDPGDLDAALALATRYDAAVVIEEAVEGREIEIGVLGWPELRASVPGEIKPAHDFYDFADKYLDGAAGLQVPAEIPDEVASEMGRLAISACTAMRVDSMARVDFFYEEGGRGLLLNEVNTIPGFTPISMYPRMWAESGVSYSELLDILVDQALRRSGRRTRFQTGR